MTIYVRPATTADQAAINALLELLHGRPTASSLPAVRARNATLACEVDGRIVGMVVLTSVDYGVEAYATIEELVVAPAHRGTGVGRQLLSSARAWAHEQACDVVFVSALDERAADFYRRGGFADCTGPWLYATLGQAGESAE